VTDELIHQAVARHARRTPDAIAVVDRGQRLDYRTLDGTADAWAASLAEAGVAPGTLVPLLLPRSTRLAVALLAVFKCGAAYAALDPRWPRERVAGLLARLDPPVLVTDDAAAHPEVRAWRAPDEPGAAQPERLFSPYAGGADTPACVFFTSGTSGIPKGVVSPHRATTRLFTPDGPLAFGPGTVLLQAAPASWDAFSLELWGALTTGGTCAVAPDDYLLPETLHELVDSAGVNTAWLTSSLFNLFNEIDPDCFAGLRRLYIGGERLSVEFVGQFLAGHSEIELFNGYGPVESCVFATTHHIGPADLARPDGVPIGRPVPGTEVHVLDADDHVCPPGAAGELCVSGAGLATGYLHDRELTAARFGDVVIDGRRRRVYRTGDRGYRDADGLLHFTGRVDRQVKVRGYRIEPEEIEACAGGLPQVSRCAAVPVPGELGTYDWLALFYTGGTPADDVSGIRRSLAQRLPAYAVPDVVRRVDRLPITSNGKIDHAALLSMLAA
jgi:D-alanine--poly(phosphoribitol) ligase subunit 1